MSVIKDVNNLNFEEVEERLRELEVVMEEQQLKLDLRPKKKKSKNRVFEKYRRFNIGRNGQR
jgi:hypothetical protein